MRRLPNTQNYTRRAVIGGVLAGILVALMASPHTTTKKSAQATVTKTATIAPTQTITPTPTATQAPRPTKAPAKWHKEGQKWIGKVSHYSRAGCLGCSPTLTMANGQPLDDNAMTIAFNWLPMNTQVRVTNMDTGVSVEATVTDTGGFNRLGRMADLVPAVANALGTKTDITNVSIEAL